MKTGEGVVYQVKTVVFLVGSALLICSASVIGEKIMRSVPLRNYPYLRQALKFSALYKQVKPQIYNFIGKILSLGKTSPLAYLGTFLLTIVWLMYEERHKQHSFYVLA